MKIAFKHENTYVLPKGLLISSDRQQFVQQWFCLIDNDWYAFEGLVKFQFIYMLEFKNLSFKR